MKYHDKILNPPFRLPTHIMEGRVEIIETYPKSEENYKLFCHSCVHLQTFTAISLSRNAKFWSQHFIT